MYTIENLLAETLREDGQAYAEDYEEMLDTFSEDFLQFANVNGIKNWEEGASGFYYELASKAYPSRFFQGHEITQEEFGGAEGDGAMFFYIIKWNGRLFRITGRRNSWDSDYWEEDVVEVEPRTVEVIEYFPIDK